MPKPAVWNNEPECGHEVASIYQTHYCTYIRVPRLLSLQPFSKPDDLILITACQWHELWCKVLLADLRAALADDCATYEPVKLLKRGIELLRLFETHADMIETVAVRDAKLTQPVRAAEVTTVSEQFAEILTLSRQLPRLARQPNAGLADAVHDYLARLKNFRPRYNKFLKATLKPKRSNAPTYAEWLKLPDLLSLQEGVRAGWVEKGGVPAEFWKPDGLIPDEMMFVVVHQCFEVWFKVMLDHIDRALPLLMSGDVSAAHHLLNRLLPLQRMLVQQIQIPATMLPLDFLRFRSMSRERDGGTVHTGLSPASGTESYQFREIEIVCGLRDDPAFRKFLSGSDRLAMRPITPKQGERLNRPTLPEALRQAMTLRGLERYDDLFTAANAPNPNADLAALADALLEFDEFFRFWRLGHISMVEKMIGARSGTGFLGSEYLMETAGIKTQEHNRVFDERQFRPRFFEELWAVRTRMGSS